jgi:dihydrofolate reductase
VTLTLIASVSQNGVIGRSGDLAWRDRDDLQRVKRMTLGRTLVMGRRTFESIDRPLPDRRTIVVTHRTDWAPGGVTVAGSLEAAMALADDDEVVCFGGGEIYAQLIDDADRLEITEIESVLDGDVYFPTIDPTCWRETERVQRDGYSWVTYLREDALFTELEDSRRQASRKMPAKRPRCIT